VKKISSFAICVEVPELTRQEPNESFSVIPNKSNLAHLRIFNLFDLHHVKFYYFEICKTNNTVYFVPICDKNYIFPTSLMKMILSSLNLMRKIGVCITSEENGECKLTSEENLNWVMKV
jgi:hypothetical protein